MSKPSDKAPTWRSEPVFDRVHTCAAMLSIHGLLTDAERRRVNARIKKWANGYDFGNRVDDTTEGSDRP